MPKKLPKKENFFNEVKEETKEIVKEEKKIFIIHFAKKLSGKKFQIGTFVVVGLLIIALILGYNYYQNGHDLAAVGGKLTSSQISGLISEIGDKMLLPKNETPTIATVTDITKLEGQQFFRNAQNGDKVIIYGSTRQAILYRQAIHKIIAVAPINEAVNQQQQATQAAPSVSATPSTTPPVSPTPNVDAKLKVVVLNSTKTAGLAKKGSALISTDLAEILSMANAQGEYATTTVSSVSKDNKVSDANLKALVSAFSKIKPTVSSLPPDEAVPAGADVVIILGKDFSNAY